MKKNNAVKFLITIVSVGILSSYSTVIWAATKTELNNQKEEIQGQKSQTEQQIKQVETEISSTESQVEDLNAQISGYETEIRNMEQQIKTMEEDIEKTTQELEQKQKEYEEKMAAFQERLVTIYENGQTSYLDVLLTSKSITDFLSNYYLLAEITQHDNDYLENLEEQKKEIEAQKTALETSKKQLDAAKGNKEVTNNSLKNARAAKNEHIEDLTIDKAELEKKRKAYDTAVAEINAQIDAIIKQEANSNPNSQYAGGEMAWPLPGYGTITAGFGWYYPFGKKKWHSGMDISGSNVTGKPIVAANDGVVKLVGWSPNGYGNYIMIDHGGGIVTLYGHGKTGTIKVNKGDKVKRGQTIMGVGNTGYSTGAHLHFEVRVNGTAVNPYPYVT